MGEDNIGHVPRDLQMIVGDVSPRVASSVGSTDEFQATDEVG